MWSLVDQIVWHGLVVRAALRVWWHNSRQPLDQLVETLRTTRRLPPRLSRPAVLQDIVNRWYRWLPPRGLRSCLKRSLLLLDLWSRCGLHPEFHLGVAGEGDDREGHAWVSADGIDSGSENRFRDAYRV